MTFVPNQIVSLIARHGILLWISYCINMMLSGWQILNRWIYLKMLGIALRNVNNSTCVAKHSWRSDLLNYCVKVNRLRDTEIRWKLTERSTGSDQFLAPSFPALGSIKWSMWKIYREKQKGKRIYNPQTQRKPQLTFVTL